MKGILYLVMVMVSVTAFAQNRDNIWLLNSQVLGYNSGIDFSSGTADTFSDYDPLLFFLTNSSICDTSGQILFYTNGIYIANKNHDSLLNSYNFNPGDDTEDQPYGL